MGVHHLCEVRLSVRGDGKKGEEEDAEMSDTGTLGTWFLAAAVGISAAFVLVVWQLLVVVKAAQARLVLLEGRAEHLRQSILSDCAPDRCAKLLREMNASILLDCKGYLWRAFLEGKSWLAWNDPSQKLSVPKHWARIGANHTEPITLKTMLDEVRMRTELIIVAKEKEK